MRNNNTTTAVIIHTSTSFQDRCRASTGETIMAMQVLTHNAFKLFMYYCSKSTGWQFNDTDIAHCVGVKDRTLQNLRNELIDKGYLLICKGDVDNYFVGRGAVTKWHEEISHAT